MAGEWVSILNYSPAGLLFVVGHAGGLVPEPVMGDSGTRGYPNAAIFGFQRTVFHFGPPGPAIGGNNCPAGEDTKNSICSPKGHGN